AERASRLALCDLTGRVLQQGLALLGIQTVEQM
ncbi:MAG TPA: DALR anticodon-binding domain-containing protein, partial [Verrucomicrobiae bacterium]|nr:DALR anticodon-binding domain-containing protein [Verrucomicrobiae bacterium]